MSIPVTTLSRKAIAGTGVPGVGYHELLLYSSLEGSVAAL
jgi:hypothetical protein